jgi:hypothetical protein
MLTPYGWVQRSKRKHCTDENRDVSAGTVQFGKQMSVPTLYSTVKEKDVSAKIEQLGTKM